LTPDSVYAWGFSVSFNGLGEMKTVLIAGRLAPMAGTVAPVPMADEPQGTTNFR
jgi:hypothetical protein